MEIDNNEARQQLANVNYIDSYLDGTHKVLGRKDFEFKGETFTTAKIVLQSIKSVIQFHSSYLAGNPVSITGDKGKTKLLQSIYKKANYSKTDYDIAKNVITYGNAYEYVYKDKDGVIRSKVFDNADSYAIYDDNGEYIEFIDKWYSDNKEIEHQTIYYKNRVEVYVNDILQDSYRNPSGLPIHYTSGTMDKTNIYGSTIVNDLIPIQDQIEQILSKVSDAVTTLSTNPIGIASGDKVDSNVSKDMVGATLHIECGGEFKWATAELDYNSIKMLLDNLINQYFTIACVPSSLFGNSNIANVSEVSLKLLFSQSDSLAKGISLSLIDGMNKRLQYIGKLSNDDFEDIDISFNYNRPIDNTELVSDLINLYDKGLLSKESVLRCSPYSSNVDRELKMIEKDKKENSPTNNGNNGDNGDNNISGENKETTIEDNKKKDTVVA